MAKSIMHQKDGTCYLCMMLKGDYDDHKVTEEHHTVFGRANRTLAEHYGLKVYLCPEHHRTSKEAVHKNYKNARYLQEKAQERFEEIYPNLDFKDVFGKYFKEPRKEPKEIGERLQQDEHPGFKFIEEE